MTAQFNAIRFRYMLIISFSEPNKTEIETLLREMKKQLTQVQNDVNILANKTSVKGEYKYFCVC